MIRPTMSHAINKDDLHVLMRKYAIHLEDELSKTSKRIEELESDLKIALSDKTIDLVRCGIGGNYGGSCYEAAMLKYHSPLVELKEQLRKEQE